MIIYHVLFLLSIVAGFFIGVYGLFIGLVLLANGDPAGKFVVTIAAGALAYGAGGGLYLRRSK